MPELDKSTLAAGEQLFERQWQLLKSVPSLEFLPPADKIEVVMESLGKSFSKVERQPVVV